MILFLGIVTGICFFGAEWKIVMPVVVKEKASSNVKVEKVFLPSVTVVEEFPQPLATVTDDELLQMARAVVAISSQRGLAWVEAQTDTTLRARMQLAVLRAWGEREPQAAVHWVLEQADDVREADMRAALTGAARQPDAAMEIARELLVADLNNGGAYAAMLARAFSADGKFQEALRFINGTTPGAMGDPVKVVFEQWAQRDPQSAMGAVGGIVDPQLRTAAFQKAVTAWNANNPGGLAAYAQTLPTGDDRSFALNAAMQNWSLQDPAALAGWLNTLPPGADFDAGAALMLAKTDGANRPPELAMEWVANISDPALQENSLTRVIGEWNQSDPAAARQYVMNALWMDEGLRARMLKKLAGGSGGG